MTDQNAVNEPLILDLCEWVARRPRTYAEVMEAWRTSCPRLDIWEAAVDRGFVLRDSPSGGAPTVRLTEAGRAALLAAGRGAEEPAA